MGTGQKERLRLCAADTLCVFRPIADRPLVALHRDRCDRLGDRRSIVVVVGRFGEQEDMLIGFGRPVFHSLRQAVRLLPDNIAPQIPAVRTKCKGKLPWDADHILFLNAVPFLWECGVLIGIEAVVGLFAFGAFGKAFAPNALAASGVAVGNVQPKCPVAFQHTAHLTEDFGQAVYIFKRRLFTADLSLGTVVTKPVVGRAGDAHLYVLVRKPFQHLQCIAAQDGVL